MILRIFFFLSLFLASPLVAGDLILQVKVESESKSTDHKSPEKTRVHSLLVRVTNSTSTKLEGLTLRWKLYSANLQRGADEISVEKSGDVKFGVEPNGQFTDVSTPKVPFTYSPQHSEKTGSGRRTSYKRVAESGHRYHGYAVQVLNGESVIAEALSNESLRHLK